jgi:hypothetical protein
LALHFTQEGFLLQANLIIRLPEKSCAERNPPENPFFLNPKTHNKPPTNNQITNHFVQLNCNAFIQRNGGRTCTPTTPPYTPLHSTEGNYMKPSPPSPPPPWSKGNYMKPWAPPRSKGTSRKPSFLLHHRGAREIM